ncbi:MAG: hypothetical protein AAB353_03290 [Candidatus Hydrogenedentota bacterium]
MKKLAVVIAAAGAILGAAALVSAQDAKKSAGEKGMVIGIAIALPHYVMDGVIEGEDATKAMGYEADKGFPVGILEDETGEIWLCVWRDNAPASHLESANGHFQGLMGTKVVAQGLKYKGKGANVMRVSLISEY